MLQTIRDRAQGIFAWIILILIIVPFALWGIQNYFDTGKEKPIASVGKREFFERDLLRLYEQEYAQYLGRTPYNEEQLKQQALDRLIDDEVLFQTATKKKLSLSDAQIAQFIKTLPFFQTEGKFDEEKYRSLLATQGISIPQFVAQVRRNLMLEQLRRSITDSSFATENEAERFYQLQNQRRKIAYLSLPVDEQQITVTQDEIKAFYHKNQDQFLTPEQVSIQYITLSLDEIARNIQPSEDQLRAFYEEQKQAYTTPEERRVRHILIAVPSDASAEIKQEALEKAKQIKEKLGKGEDFSKLAKQLSEDPGSKDKGGDLGFVRRGLMEKNFEDVAFSLAEGEISEPVETPFGFHIIQVTEIKPTQVKPYQEVRDQILKEVQKNEAENRFYEMGERLAQLAYENPQSLEPAAKSLNLEIQQSDYFSRQKGKGIAANPKIRETAFSEEVLEGNNSEPIELNEGEVVIIRLLDHRPAQQKPLSQVAEQISRQLRQQKARQRAEAKAKEWLTQLQSGKSLQALAKDANLTIKEIELERASQAAEYREIAKVVFKATKPSPQKPVYQMATLSDGRPVLIELREVIPGDFAGLTNEEKTGLRQNLARLLGLLTFKDYQSQLRDEAKVEINWPPQDK